MENETLISSREIRLLCAAGNGDAALLLLFLRDGGMDESAEKVLRFDPERHAAAETTLRQLGLLAEASAPRAETRPVYSEETVMSSLQKSADFGALVGETQRTLGRVLSTEELKCLLSVYDFLRLPSDVVSILVSYCVEMCRARGGRMPSMRQIEKEAYRWADCGIDTVERAVQYMQGQLARQSKMGQLAAALQLGGRRLTTAETQYLKSWIGWGFPEESILLAYEKTCLNTGGLKWPYMNSILKSWHEKNLRTVEEIRNGDLPSGKKIAAKQGPSELERDAVRRLMGSGEG